MIEFNFITSSLVAAIVGLTKFRSFKVAGYYKGSRLMLTEYLKFSNY